MLRHVHCRIAVAVMRRDPHPVLASTCRKVDHARSRIFPHQHLLIRKGSPLAGKYSDLHTPSSARPNGLRRPVNVHPHPIDSIAVNSHRLGRGNRKIHNPPFDKRPSIGDVHGSRLPCPEIRHQHQRSQRQCPVGGRHRVVIQRKAVRLLTPFVIPIPTGSPYFAQNRLVRLNVFEIRLGHTGFRLRNRRFHRHLRLRRIRLRRLRRLGLWQWRRW